MVPEDPEVLVGPGCTAEGSPGVDRSLEAGRNLEGARRIAVMIDRSAVEEVHRCDHRCSSHWRAHGRLEQHRWVLHERHRGEAASLRWSGLPPSQRCPEGGCRCKSSPVGLSLGLSSSSSNSFIFFLRKSMLMMGYQALARRYFCVEGKGKVKKKGRG